MQPGPDDTMLDIGVSYLEPGQLTLEAMYPYRHRIVGGGLDTMPGEVARARTVYPEIQALIFDGCALPFDDGAFDLVFSNAVIEHVGPSSVQEQFAREVMRVGRRWFVTTPNARFPVELHYQLPLIHWLPATWKHGIVRRLLGRDDEIHLLTANRLRRLFPGAVVLQQRVTFWPETLIAYKANA